MGKKGNPSMNFLMVIMASGIARRARKHDDDGDGVAQHGGHTPSTRLTETYSLGLPFASLILHIHVMINWHLSKQGIRWPVSRDHIAGSSVQLIEVTCFLKLTADQVLVFYWIAGSCQVNLLKTGQDCSELLTLSCIRQFRPQYERQSKIRCPTETTR